MDPYVGEIRIFAGNYAPMDWAICDGTLLSIANNEMLFALIGTTYGGDGQITFALPDFRGRGPNPPGTGRRCGGRHYPVRSPAVAAGGNAALPPGRPGSLRSAGGHRPPGGAHRSGGQDPPGRAGPPRGHGRGGR